MICDQALKENNKNKISMLSVSVSMFVCSCEKLVSLGGLDDIHAFCVSVYQYVFVCMSVLCL